MRIILTILILILTAIGPTYTTAQTPLGINYQGIARSGDGSPIVNQPIGLRMSITSGPDGSTDYMEEHHVITNEFGLFTVIVGNGQSGGSLNDVDWVAGNKWLQVEIDAQDIGNYMVVGSQQLLSVPYALFAAQSGDALNPGIGIDISNGRVNNVLPDQIITLTGGGGTTVSGTYPNFSINSVDNVNDADADATNEIQTITLNGTNLELSDGNSVDLAAFVNTDGQNLADVLAQGADANGATITGLADPIVAQDAATKNYVDNLDAQDLDKDNSNEIQDLQLAANSLSITNNTSATAIDLSGYLDNTDAQNLSNVLGQSNDAGNTKITYLGAPTAPQDAATKGYVDGQVVALSTDLSTNTTAIGDLQNELDITQNASGLSADGTYSQHVTSNFLGSAVNLHDADAKLDIAIESNASSIADLTSRIDNTYAFSANFSTDASAALNKAPVTLVESLDNFNQISATEIVIGATGLYMIVVDAERSNFDGNFNNLYLSINSVDSNLPVFTPGFNSGKTIIRYLNSGDTIRILITTASSLTYPFVGMIGGYKISD